MLFRQFLAYINCALVCFPLAYDKLTVKIRVVSRVVWTNQGNQESEGKESLCGGTGIAVVIQDLP